MRGIVRGRFYSRIQLYHCPFEIGLCSGKGGMAVSAVWRLVCFLAPCPSEPKEQTAAHRRDALCPSTKIQKQAAFGISHYFRHLAADGYECLSHLIEISEKKHKITRENP